VRTPLPEMAVPQAILDMVDPLTRTRQQLDGCAACLRWASNTDEARATSEGIVVIHRSVPQLIRGMGLPNGPTVERTHQRWRNQVYRWGRYLAPLGITVQEAPKARDGRGTGILIRIPAGVAQSVRAAES
jgi:hypothetical protein